MANDALHRCVTKFMLGTCYTKTEYAEVIFAMRCTATINGDVDAFVSGSSVELRIKPMLLCLGDFDVMHVENDVIAIPHGHTPPTELDGRYQRVVYAYEIIDSHHPGFVYLRKSYRLTKNDNGLYVTEVIENSDRQFLNKFVAFGSPVEEMKPSMLINHFPEAQYNRSVQSIITPAFATHGPAINFPVSNELFFENCKPTHPFSYLSFDYVSCMRCLLWPILAANWPTREREHGWPDQTTITGIVINGCDLVGAVHPCCRQDEWMNEHQWRLSFSRAEVTLLNSWTKVQQIVYHMLRFVFKQEILRKADGKEHDLAKLSNYHIKTLMLWQCERKPQSWWSAESSFIKLCSSLLHKLSDWVEHRHCQHYFISSSNLLDYFVKDGSTMIRNSLRSLADESILLWWFIENYLCRCALYCPGEVSVLFEDIGSSDKLQIAVDAVVDWKLNTMPQELCKDYYRFELMTLCHILFNIRTDTMWIQPFMKELQNIDLRLQDYFVAVMSLFVAYRVGLSRNSPTKDMLEILWTLYAPYTASVSDISTSGPEHLCILKAIKLATVSTDRSSALEMLYDEMSKAYLHHSFAYGQKSSYCMVHVLLAALYYKSGHYQTSSCHCQQVLNRYEPEYSSQCILAKCLPHIDERVDAVFSLVLLYQYIQWQVLPPGIQKEQFSRTAFTAQLLAHYMYSKSSVAAGQQSRITRNYHQHLCWTKRPLLCDVLLLKIITKERDKCTKIGAQAANTESYNAEEASTSMDTSLLVTMLELVALEKLISVRQVMVHQLHSEQFPVLNEFQALHAYRCGLLEECLIMCQQNVKMLLRAGCPRHQNYLIVFPEFLSMLDGELVSLYGIIRILRPNLFLLTADYTCKQSISLLTLSLYLMVQCQKKLRSDSHGDTLRLIRYVHDQVFIANGNTTFVDLFILKLIYRSLKLYIDGFTFSN